MYDTNAVNAVTRAMRSEVSDHVTASEKKSLREVRALVRFTTEPFLPYHCTLERFTTVPLLPYFLDPFMKIY